MKPTPYAFDEETLINVRQVCAMFGGVSDMWIWRKLQDDALGFPRPIKITGRNYWRHGDVRRWREAQAERVPLQIDAAPAQHLRRLTDHLTNLGDFAVLEFIAEMVATYGTDVLDRLEARINQEALRRGPPPGP